MNRQVELLMLLPVVELIEELIYALPRAAVALAPVLAALLVINYTYLALTA